MKKIVDNKRGAILVFILIIYGILILAFTTLLSSTVMNYKMQKMNSKIKKRFYYAEAGLDEAYAMTLEYLSAVLDYFHGNNEENDREDEEIYNNFKNMIKGTKDNMGLKKILADKDNYIIDNKKLIINVELKEKENYFLLKISSGYKTGIILNKISLSCKIMIPQNKTRLEGITAKDLITDSYWHIEKEMP
ncbi:MAG: hypothetical protein M0P77_02170 [Firmicutes bacterium]|nr:hypothetical protein [Bacillota bacterium]